MTAETVVVRPMCREDLPQVLEIAASLGTAPHWPESAYLTAMDPATTPQRIALVAADPAGGALAGFCVTSLIAPQAELETVAVAAECQGRGLGRTLLKRLFAELQRAEIKEIHLESRTSNQRAMKLYCGIGFVETGLRTSYYADPIEDAVVMSLTIS